ncbi:nucleotidyltransferase domain-containing protein [Nitrosomonas sp. ANs5]|uniref:nucleotidyltransferase domain-containing protein n=1 Tax=Nitrosomonas sp. ANs5 TaxID=3423941 RepID=UPI003D356963
MTEHFSSHHQLLLTALRDPRALTAYSIEEWELLLRLARRVKLLGYLAVRLDEHNLLEVIPARAANLIRSALIRTRKFQQLARWELDRVQWALQDDASSLIVLKGMAYLLADLPIARGRLFADVDLLAPKGSLPGIEATLLQKGWRHHQNLTSYDERYYREWSHELPAFVHRERETEVDIHHTLVSPLGKLKLDATAFRQAAIPLEGGWCVLCPEDMTLHCALNLFQNNELADDLRHLLDLHEMLQFFSDGQPLFWQKLVDRANQLGLGWPLFYGLYFSRLLFQATLPEGLEEKLHQRPGRLARRVMRACVPLALLPLDPDKPSRRAGLARLWLYWRSHWLRMPFSVLLPHLAYKSYLSIFLGKPAENRQANR